MSPHNNLDTEYGTPLIKGSLPKSREALDALVLMHRRETGLVSRVPQLTVIVLTIVCTTLVLLWSPEQLHTSIDSDTSNEKSVEFSGFGVAYKGGAVGLLLVMGIAGSVVLQPKELLG